MTARTQNVPSPQSRACQSVSRFHPSVTLRRPLPVPTIIVTIEELNSFRLADSGSVPSRL